MSSLALVFNEWATLPVIYAKFMDGVWWKSQIVITSLVYTDDGMKDEENKKVTAQVRKEEKK